MWQIWRPHWQPSVGINLRPSAWTEPWSFDAILVDEYNIYLTRMRVMHCIVNYFTGRRYERDIGLGLTAQPAQPRSRAVETGAALKAAVP